MAKKAYVGIGDKARTVKNIFIGVGNKARKVVKAYVGDENGKARQWWPSLISKTIFNGFVGFGFYDFTTYSATSRSVQDSFVEYTKYAYTGNDRGGFLFYHLFTGFNVFETGTNNSSVGPNNPVRYRLDPDWKLEIPAGESYEWWMTIPILAFGVVEVEVSVTGYSTFEICYVGIATRVQDNTREKPDYYSQGAQVENQTVRIKFSTNSRRADYLYISGSNFMGFGTRLRINEIKITCERPYGKVYGVYPGTEQPWMLNVNFPRFGYDIGGSYAELMVTAATSAVYMLIYTSNNDYIGDHEYADIKNGDSWGTGTTFVIFISKNTFTLNWCQYTNIGPAQTINSASLDGKTTYYFRYVLPADAQAVTAPLYNHAYTEYIAQDWSDIPTKIASLGNSVLYDHTIE